MEERSSEERSGRQTFKTTRKLPGNYPEATRKLLEVLLHYPHITRKKLANHLGMTEDGVKYHLKHLTQKGVLERIGPARGGYWQVIEKEVA